VTRRSAIPMYIPAAQAMFPETTWST